MRLGKQESMIMYQCLYKVKNNVTNKNVEYGRNSRFEGKEKKPSSR